MEGELSAGKSFSQPIGNSLRVYFQPIESGWIVRVLPLAGPVLEPDYAEVATPPYNSVTPLSITTDFAFRAQDAVGWNPRRFHFASTVASYRQLAQLYQKVVEAGTSPVSGLDAELARRLEETSEATLTIQDSRLVPGTADQWRAAAGVASHFASTAHRLLQEPDGHTTALGRLVWLRVRLEFELPDGFVADPKLQIETRPCVAS